MKLNLRITAGLLLLVQTFHMASLQNSTDSPGRTIHREWLRKLAKNTAGSQNAALPGEEIEYDQRADATTAESSNDYSSGIASGSMAVYNEEEENVTSQDKDTNDGSDDLTAVTATMPPTNPNVTTKEPELTDTTVSPSNATTDPTNSSSINTTEAEEGFNTTTTPQNSTSSPNHSNHTDLQTTTSAPEGNATQVSTTKAEDTRSTYATGSTNMTTLITTATPETYSSSTTSSPTTVFSSEKTETSPATTTAAEKSNRTGEDSASGENPERGLESDPHRSKRNGAWGAVLGTAVAVAFVGLVAYVILKKKHQKGFSHRKLVEEFPSDPVLRLDNNEPLDLNLGGSAYYNPALQGDNIQMSNLPGRR
ncbi:uncharacterized protein [Pagrus major]|uniref:uncharacterized protein n=1 Tax=Pagrus major TaxID=143350 RepID=UPI003CC8A889